MNWTEILGNGWAWTVALVVVGAALMWFGRRRTTTIDPGRTLLATGDTPRRDKAREIWDGRRHGVAGARQRFGVDAAFPIAELWERLPGLVAGRSPLFHRLGVDASFADPDPDAIRAAFMVDATVDTLTFRDLQARRDDVRRKLQRQRSRGRRRRA